jgi:hypothetical protein
MPDYAKLRGGGWDTPLFAANDPRLAMQIAAARQAGMQYGIWADPNWYDDRSPEAFAQQMAALQQRYGPSVLVPDIEFIGKGYRGSQGWDYNDQLAKYWKQYLPGARTAITPMGNQADFNYEAWNGIANEWLPQAYGADSNREGLDPRQVRQTLIDRGVDPNLITPILSPANVRNGYQGNYGIWTYDDLMTGGLPQAYSGVVNPDAPPHGRPDATPGAKMLDSMNPRAQAYARMRLQQAQRLGLIKDMPQGDLAAAWRQVSQGVVPAAQAAGFSDPRAYLRSGNVQKKPMLPRPSGPGPRKVATAAAMARRAKPLARS